MFRLLIRTNLSAKSRPNFRFQSSKPGEKVEGVAESATKGGGGKFFLVLTPLAAGFGVLGYAAFDKEWRDKLAGLPGGASVVDAIPDFTLKPSTTTTPVLTPSKLDISQPPIDRSSEKKLADMEIKHRRTIDEQSQRIEELESRVKDLVEKSKEWESSDDFSLEFRKATTEAINRARRKANADVIIDEKELEEALTQQREMLDKEFKSQITILREEFENEMKRQLRRQVDVHTEALNEGLQKQKDAMLDEFEIEQTKALRAQREKFDEEMTVALARLRGIEAAVNARADAEAQFRKSREFWHASHALKQAIEKGSEGTTWEEKQQPLSETINIIQDSSNHHPFVRTVLNSLPDCAASKGVYTVDSLRERFDVVRKEARKVAMIEDVEKASLFQYFLSHVQSWLIFDSNLDVSHDETIDSVDLNTFRLLGSARKCMEEGKIELAVRFMNQLRGLPKQVASEWLAEARLYLEAKQAAEVLLAHASANGLETVPIARG